MCSREARFHDRTNTGHPDVYCGLYESLQRNPDGSSNNNSMALVRERTIPTKRQPLVGEVLRIEGAAWLINSSHPFLSKSSPIHLR
jgi:hypothetical protein